MQIIIQMNHGWNHSRSARVRKSAVMIHLVHILYRFLKLGTAMP